MKWNGEAGQISTRCYRFLFVHPARNPVVSIQFRTMIVFHASETVKCARTRTRGSVWRVDVDVGE